LDHGGEPEGDERHGPLLPLVPVKDAPLLLSDRQRVTMGREDRL
jgi:hypothetical protein